MRQNNAPLYVHIEGSHPPSVIKNIPGSINKRLYTISSNEAIQWSGTNLYQEALKLTCSFKNENQRNVSTLSKYIWTFMTVTNHTPWNGKSLHTVNHTVYTSSEKVQYLSFWKIIYDPVMIYIYIYIYQPIHVANLFTDVFPLITETHL